MARVAFTICLNAAHHLKHNDYVRKLLPHMDCWVFVEGAAESNGSTTWCKSIGDQWQKDGLSVDGTVEFLDSLLEHENVCVVKHSGFWKSKDEMVNSALACLSVRVKTPAMLWEIDADEQWTIEGIVAAETELVVQDAKTGTFLANHYVGKNLIARGEWGEGKKQPYRRLWLWNDERFKTHEPPELEGGNGKTVLLPQRFNHYAYYFEQDVKFKDEWYGGHEGLYKRWLELQKGGFASIHVSALISGPWGQTDTYIHPIEELEPTGSIVYKAPPELKKPAIALDGSDHRPPKKKILVVSHERSGTHFLFNSLAENIEGYSNQEISIQQAERSFQIDKPSIDAVKEQLFSYFGKSEPRIFKSHHQYDFFAPYIDELIKEYHIVYMVRDGRDVLNSCLHYFNQAPAEEFPRCKSMAEFLEVDPGKYSFDREYSLVSENNFSERWANHCAEWIRAHDKISIVKYEDLESNFDTTMRVLASQMGVDLPKELIKPGLKSRSIYPRKGKSGDWIHSFTRMDRDTFDVLADRSMRFFKYYPPNTKTCVESLQIKRNTVALNIIVGGDEQRVLRRALSSFQAHLFDEVVIVCTTNDPDVWKVAQEFTEKVISFKWINDFSAARNCAIEHTDSTYIWWCDADDILTKECAQGMPEALRVIRSHDFDYYTMKYVIERRNGLEYQVIPKRPAVFKKHESVKWVKPIHEALTLQNRGNPSSFSGIVIEHRPDKSKSSAARNLAILEKTSEDDPRMMFYYGRELMLSGRVPEGLKKLKLLVERGKAIPEELAYSCFEIGSNAFDKRNFAEAEAYAKLGLKHSRIYAELYVLLGDTMAAQKYVGDAIACYKRAGALEPDGALCQDVRFYKFLPADRISNLHFQTKNYGKALAYNDLAAKCGMDTDRLAKNRKKIIEALNG